MFLHECSCCIQLFCGTHTVRLSIVNYVGYTMPLLQSYNKDLYSRILTIIACISVKGVRVRPNVNWLQCKPVVETAAPELWLYPSPHSGGGSMRASPVLNLYGPQTPQPSGAPSSTYPGTCLSGIHKKPGNLHMGPGTQLLPALLWGYNPLVLLVVVWGWCWGGKRPSILVESGLAALLRTDRAHMGGWPLDPLTGRLQVPWGLV